MRFGWRLSAPDGASTRVICCAVDGVVDIAKQHQSSSRRPACVVGCVIEFCVVSNPRGERQGGVGRDEDRAPRPRWHQHGPRGVCVRCPGCSIIIWTSDSCNTTWQNNVTLRLVWQAKHDINIPKVYPANEYTEKKSTKMIEPCGHSVGMLLSCLTSVRLRPLTKERMEETVLSIRGLREQVYIHAGEYAE